MEPPRSLEFVLKGYMGVKVQQRSEPRFFVLHPDRLLYYKTEEDFDKGEAARYAIDLSSVAEAVFDAEDGPQIMLSFEEHNVFLMTSIEYMFEWLEELRRLLPPEVVVVTWEGSMPQVQLPEESGTLVLDRKGKLTERFCVLLSDGIEFYEDETARRVCKPLESVIMLKDVLQMQVLETSFSLKYWDKVATEEAIMKLEAPGKKEYMKWVESFEHVLKSKLGDNYIPYCTPITGREPPTSARKTRLEDPKSPKTTLSPATTASSNAFHASGRSATTTVSPSPRNNRTDRPRAPSPKVALQQIPAPPEPRPQIIPIDDERIVMQGLVEVIRKGRVELRYAVLWRDRFEYFNTPGEVRFGNAPRCRVPMTQVLSLDMLEAGFLIRVADRLIEIQTDSMAELVQWKEAWATIRRAFEEQEGAGERARAAKLRSSPRSGSPARAESMEGSPCRSAASVGTESMDARLLSAYRNSVATGSLVQEGSQKVTPGAEARRVKPATEEGKSVVEKQAGAVLWVQRGKAEARYLSLSGQGVLEIFNEDEYLARNAKALEKVAVKDVDECQVTMHGFCFDIGGTFMDFRCTEKDATEWVKTILASGGTPHKAGALSPISAVLAQCSIVMTPIVPKGAVTKGRKMVVALYEDRLEYAPTGEALKTANAIKCMWRYVASLTMHSGSKTISLVMTNKDNGLDFDMQVQSIDYSNVCIVLHNLMPREKLKGDFRLPSGGATQKDEKANAGKLQPHAKGEDRRASSVSAGQNSRTDQSPEATIQAGNGRRVRHRPSVMVHPGVARAHSPPLPQHIFEGSVLVTVVRHGSHKKERQEQRHLTIVKVPGVGCNLQFLASESSDPHAKVLDVKINEVRTFRVLDDGFHLSTDAQDVKLKVQGPIDPWVTGFRDAFRAEAQIEAQLKAPIDPIGSAHTSPYHLPLASPYLTPRSVITVNSPASPSSPRRGESPRGYGQAQSPKVLQWNVAELNDPKLLRWLEMLQGRDPVIHQGLLGVQPKDQMVSGYFVLFGDRLDFWNRPLEAALGSKPRGRVKLSDIRNLETVSSGFVLNTNGRKMGLHVQNSNDMEAWTKAFLKALAPTGVPVLGSERSLAAILRPHIGEDAIQRLKKRFKTLVKDTKPVTADKISQLVDPKQAGSISEHDLRALLKTTLRIRDQNKVDPDEDDIVSLVKGLTDGSKDSSDQLPTSRIVDFILQDEAELLKELPPEPTPVAQGQENKRRRPNTWLPRVATLTDYSKKKDDTEAEDKDGKGDEKKPKPNIYIGAQGATETREGGFRFTNKELINKVTQINNNGENVPPTIKRPKSASADHIENRVIEERVLTPRCKEVQWSKITISDNQDLAKGKFIKPYGGCSIHDGVEMPPKIGSEIYVAVAPRVCSTAKVNEPRKPLAEQEYMRIKNEKIVEKVTDHGRTNIGWASPYESNTTDRTRPIGFTPPKRPLTFDQT